MFRNFLILAIRNLLKNKVHSFISIIGLTVGLAVFILVSLYLKFEYSWDKHNINYDRIYQVQQRVHFSTGDELWMQTPAPLAKFLRENYPEVENTLLLREAWGEFLSSSYVQTFFETDGYYAEPSIFSIFTYEFLEGDEGTALTDPFSVVLSQTLAEKLFPDRNAIGKNVLLDKKYNLKVTGIFKDLPLNSVVRPSYIIPFDAFEKTNQWDNVTTQWGSSSFHTCVLLDDPASKKTFESKIVNLLDAYEKYNKRNKLYLLPLKDLFLRPLAKNDYLVALFLYGLIAVFILLLACVNFINLTTANSSTRAKEIGIKKATGSSRMNLIWQFLGESVIITLVAVNFAFMVAKLFLPVFCKIINRELDFTWATHYGFILVIFVIALFVGLVSGIYPALVLSSYKTVNILKADFFKTEKGRIGLKKILVTFQFFISVFLIISTLIVFRQVNFMMNKDLGFHMENIIYAKIRSEKEDGNIREIRNRLLQCPSVENVTISENIPFHGSSGKNINWEGSGEEKLNARFNQADENFLETFQIGLLKGRSFINNAGDSSQECIINETALKYFGWDDPIGKHIDNNTYEVVGVVKDFHQYSVHEPIEPYLLIMHNGKIKGENIYSIRVRAEDMKLTRQEITGVFETYFPDDAFEFGFLSDSLCRGNAFKIWDGVNKTFRFFTALAVLISVMGLFGLISYTAKRRTKEMGIRKVFGSKPAQIYAILARDFIPLLWVAIILGSAGAYILYKYLPGAYKYQLQFMEFIIAWILTLLVALLTISYQAMQVAFSNPVDSLRYE